MKAIFKEGLLILVPQEEDSHEDLLAWKASMNGHALLLKDDAGTGLALRDLGVRDVVCKEPINVTSKHPSERIRLIANFANTAFELDGRLYAAVESFWQGLEFDGESQRSEIATLTGAEARRRGQERGYGPTIKYEGNDIVVGTYDHWILMFRACMAKFTQHNEAKAALLSTDLHVLTDTRS